MYKDFIDEFIQQHNEQLEIKCDARTEFQKAYCILKTMAAVHSPLKSTASIDNKINSLLNHEDIETAEKAIQYHQIMMIKEIEYKNARDRIELLKTQIIEYSSRRKYESEIK